MATARAPDYYTVDSALYELRWMTVEKLKSVIRNWNQFDLSRQHLKLAGRKDELYARVRDVIETLSREDQTRFMKARDIINGVGRNGSNYDATDTSPRSTSYDAAPQVSFNRAPPVSTAPAPSTSSNSYNGYYSNNVPTYGNVSSSSGGGSSTSHPVASSSYNSWSQPSNSLNKNSLPQPRFQPGGSLYQNGSSSSTSYGNPSYSNQPSYQSPSSTTTSQSTVPIRFRSSPLFRIEKAVSAVTLLPSAGQGDRKSVALTFALTSAQRQLLLSAKQSLSNPQYQVRLYCTSENYYFPSRPTTNQLPAPIEFPTTCEIKLNHFQIPSNTKGIKNQVGTAPPTNLSKSDRLNLSEGAINRVEMIYVNTDKLPSKKYYMLVYLIEMTLVSSLVERIKNGRKRTKQFVIEQIKEQNQDTDLCVSFGVAIKDPLTLARIKVPVRSINCSHVACFDAQMWFSMNEQTPTWTCPICSKVLRVEDLVYDEFIKDILDTCDSEVDAVTIEPDGTWRSDNDKFGTAPSKNQTSTKLSSKASSIKPDPEQDEDQDQDVNNNRVGDDGRRQQNGSETLLLDDSDDDSEPVVKRSRTDSWDSRASSSNKTSSGRGGTIMSTGGGVPSGRRMETIDLTLSDSEEEERDGPNLNLGKDSGGEVIRGFAPYSNGQYSF
ncbi:E3 SUMO-protein ligase pli1 [Microbotryomycetes sp. JL221]|nr:E3 SUMO-protein ligase pli1 [Microbotryomycetes sp. JL221]